MIYLALLVDVHEIVLFADDTSLLFKVKKQQPTYDDMNNCYLQDVRHGSETISVRNKDLEFVNATVLLGISLDDRLTDIRHISKFAKRLSSAAYAVKKIRNLSHVETARLIWSDTVLELLPKTAPQQREHYHTNFISASLSIRRRVTKARQRHTRDGSPTAVRRVSITSAKVNGNGPVLVCGSPRRGRHALAGTTVRPESRKLYT
ncbi:hypothetical protein EVAR_9118_1 [Eumeta japonica]|uniref:Uncharacterized protein n=1 Tax=Eumeta variegata TaxID=151549 RepID=A0A4C1TW50_EUMVA|nr:hypothetical protein EVAR_9118_1 [Eumeta japonica]